MYLRVNTDSASILIRTVPVFVSSLIILDLMRALVGGQFGEQGNGNPHIRVISAYLVQWTRFPSKSTVAFLPIGD